MKNLLIILIPIFGFLIGFFSKDFVNYLNEKKKPTLFSHLLKKILYGLISSALFFLLSQKILFVSELPALQKGIFLAIAIIALTYFIYISVFDIEYFEIPNISTFVFFALFMILNIVLIFLIMPDTKLILWKQNNFVPLENIITAIFFAALTLLLVITTKGMGAGDIRIIGYMGLILGLNKIIYGFYITIFSALIIGLLFCLHQKKIHGVRIPFVPFMVLGITFSFIFSTEISSFAFSIFHIKLY